MCKEVYYIENSIRINICILNKTILPRNMLTQETTLMTKERIVMISASF